MVNNITSQSTSVNTTRTPEEKKSDWGYMKEVSTCIYSLRESNTCRTEHKCISC